MTEADLKIVNEKGLHARASAKFVKTASAFNARVMVTRVNANPLDYDAEKDGPVSGGSLLGLMILAADIGTILRIEADGEQAEEAVNALKALIDQKFGEEE